MPQKVTSKGLKSDQLDHRRKFSIGKNDDLQGIAIYGFDSINELKNYRKRTMCLYRPTSRNTFTAV